MEDLGHVTLGKPGQPLRILQLTDLHHFPASCTEFDVSAAKGRHRIVPLAGEHAEYDTRHSLAVIRSIVQRVRPDLVVLTGDIIDGRPFGAARPLDPQGWRGALLEVLEPIVACGAAWTFVPGNHDDDGGPWSREALLDIYRLGKAAPGCISAGATRFDHTLTVGPAAPPARDALRLWLFDSGGNHEEKKLRYHTFKPEAVEGYLRLAPTLPRAECALAYFHIPFPQCGGLEPIIGQQRLFEAALNSGKVPRPFCWEPFTSLARLLGWHRAVGASKLESGLFDALAERGDVRACFFGHDHYSDAVFVRKGLYMAYGRVGATTPPSNWEGDGGPLPFEVGARVVEWDTEGGVPALRTWIENAEQRESSSELLLEPPSAVPGRLRRTRGRLLAAVVVCLLAAMARSLLQTIQK